MSSRKTVLDQLSASAISMFDPADDNTAVGYGGGAFDIDVAAKRAALLLDTETQLILSNYTDSEKNQYLETATALAAELGQLDALNDHHENPFQDSSRLTVAWQDAYEDTIATESRVNAATTMMDGQDELWERGIQINSNRCQYDIAAITLDQLGVQASDSTIQKRCYQLAQEMRSYGAECEPSPNRQEQINRFMANQSALLAQAIEEIEV